MHADDLCDSERVVWDAFPRAETVDFRTATASGHGTPGGIQAVRADVIAALLLGARTPETGRVPAVRLSGARIAGQLDLSFAEVGFAVLLRDCVFDEEPRLYGASTRLVNLSRSRLPGLQLSDAQIDGLLWLEGCRFDGPVRLTGARIAQTLSLQDAVLRGDPALMAGGLSVGRNLVCSGMRATNGCRMPNARVGGTLFLNGAHLECPGDVALAADGLIADQGVFCKEGFTADGEVQLQDARIGRQLTMAGASVKNKPGQAVRAERLTVDGALYLDDELTNPSGVALNGNRATIEGGIYARPGLIVRGEMSLAGAHIRGSVHLAGAQLLNSDGTALAADRIEVTGRFFCGDGFTAQGEVRLVDARIGAGLYFTGAQLSNTTGRTLTGWGLAVSGVMNCNDGFTADGPISLVSAHLDSELCFNAATIDANVNLRRLHAAVLRTDAQTVIHGTVDLRHTTVEVLQDDPAGWPRAAQLDGFTYTTLVSPLPATDRLRLLDSDPDGYHPQPYEQLAAIYRSMGNDADARTVLLAKQRTRRKTISAPLRAWGLVQDWIVGYGYQQ